MPVLISPPRLAGGVGDAVNGLVEVAATAEYTFEGVVVTTAPRSGVIRAGEFFGADAESPLELVPTPDGVGMRIVLRLEVVDVSRPWSTVHRIARTVVVPDLSQVSWAFLDDFDPSPPPIVPGSGFGLGGFGGGEFGAGETVTAEGFGVESFGSGPFGV